MQLRREGVLSAWRVEPASAPSGMWVERGPEVPVTRTPVVDDRRCSRTLIVSRTIGWEPTRGIAASHTSPRRGVGVTDTDYAWSAASPCPTLSS